MTTQQRTWRLLGAPTLLLAVAACGQPPTDADVSARREHAEPWASDAGSLLLDAATDAGSDAAPSLDAGPPDAAIPTPTGRPYTYAWGIVATHGQEDVARVGPSGEAEVITPAVFRGARFIHDVAVSDDGRRMAVAASFREEPVELWIGSPDGSAGALQTIPEGYVRELAFSPRGTNLAIILDPITWSVRIPTLLVMPGSGGAARALWGTEERILIEELVWLDENQLALVGGPGGSWTPNLVDVRSGGLPIPLVAPESIEHFNAARLTVDPDGRLYFLVREDSGRGLYRYLPREDRVERVPGVPSHLNIESFDVALGGRRVVLTSRSRRDHRDTDVYWMDLDVPILRRVDALDDFPIGWVPLLPHVAARDDGEMLLVPVAHDDTLTVVVAPLDRGSATPLYQLSLRGEWAEVFWSADGSMALARQDSGWLIGTHDLETPDQSPIDAALLTLDLMLVRDAFSILLP